MPEKIVTEKKAAGEKAPGKQAAGNAPVGKTAATKDDLLFRKPADKAAAKSGKKVRVTLVRGLIGTRESHRATVRGLGLRRINHTVELEDTPAVRGMINKVSYLLKCEA
jgi:large subunit ribosomal protein L30